MSAYSITADRGRDAGKGDSPAHQQRARRRASARSANACSTMPPSSADEADVEGGSPEPRQDHRTVPLGALTRFGCAAMYDAVCLTMIWVPSKVSDVELVK